MRGISESSRSIQCSHSLFRLALIFLSIATHGGAKSMVRLDLHPSALVEHERKLTYLNTSDLPEHWFHPSSNAVYATLPKDEDSEANQPKSLRDFHRHRHLSRWERRFRVENSIDLELDWNKTYSHRQMQEAQSLHGGRYNNYAAAPLSQGYGTHYAHLWVGSPTPQRKSVIVDTGSHYTAFPCKGCENCGAEHHTDPYFDPDLSQTFRFLSCHQCELGAVCQQDKCVFSQSYTEGSSWEAFQVEDLVYLGGRDMLAMADPRNTNYAIDFMFGCQTSENGLFVTQLADGIMGMSAHQFTLTKQMYDKKKVEHNMFAMCFRRELGTSKNGVSAGVMTLGGMDNRLDLSPMVFAKNMASTGWFTVYVRNIFIRAGGGQRATSKVEEGQHVLKIPLDLSVVNSGKGVIVDSGTTDTYLHKKLAKSFSSVWKTVTKKDYNHNGFLLTDEQLRTLPTILVQMRAYGGMSLGAPTETVGFAGTLDPAAPYDILLAIPATNYMEYSTTTGLYTSRLYFTETQGGVLGANAMQGHNVVFDWEHGRVGFAESTCDYEDEHSSVKIRGVDSKKQFGNDCALGDPVLSATCVASADPRACGDGIGQFLLGTEVWTRSVEDFGSDSGMSCHDVVLLETPHQGASPPEIICSDGVCAEYRPCQIECSEIAAAEAIVKQTDGKPCPSFWTACHESCSQTLVLSTKKTDGICHESSRETRECHFGDCGKDDPCRVPYLVHAILGFRGVNKELWTSEVTETLIQAVVDSVKGAGEMETTPFSAGDVNVLMISPWQGDVQHNGSTSRDLGVRVVLQISFYNSKAKLVNEVENGEVASAKEGDAGNQTVRKLTKFHSSSPDLQILFAKNKPKSVCIESDLSPLASSALAVQEAIQNAEFIRIVVGYLKRAEGGDQNFARSPFARLYNQNELLSQSRTISAWTIRTQVEENGARGKGLLDRTPLTKYSLSGRTIWLTLTGICILLLYGADRFIQPSHSSESRTRDANDGPFRSPRIPASSSISYSHDSESEVLLRQLFPDGEREFTGFFSDESSISSSSLIGERFVGSRGSRTSGSSMTVDLELASLSSSRKSRPSRTGRRWKK